MGEQKQNDSLDNKDTNNPTLPPGNNSFETDDQNEDVNEEDVTPEEFQVLDNQLDALLNALDDIESKNDNIHAQLLELLQANREIRKQLREEKQNESSENMDTESS